MIAGSPDRTVRIRCTPGTIVETLDRSTVVRIDSLVGGGSQGGTVVVAEVGIKVGIDGGQQTTGTLKLLLHVGRIIDTVLLIVHLLIARREEERGNRNEKGEYSYCQLVIIDGNHIS